MDLNSFRNDGFLQEANRLFFHPLGLALEVDIDNDGNVTAISGVVDSRDDVAGMCYDDSLLATDAARAKANTVNHLYTDKVTNRIDHLGYIIQPLP